MVIYQNDHLGTPQKLTAVNGAVVWSAKYSSFGEATVDLTSTVPNNLRFAGQYYDQESGLHYNWHRYYDPRTGRYMTQDPIGLIRGVNLFSYAMNNPLYWIDPFGLKEMYFWDYLPDWKTPIEALGHRDQLRYKFAREYERRMERCQDEYIKKIKTCWAQICNNQGFDLNSCEIRAENQYGHCKKRAEKFKHLSENYSWWKALKDSYLYSVDENLERHKREIDDPTDPMENWKSPQRKYWEDVYF